jgi:hypothetical protein
MMRMGEGQLGHVREGYLADLLLIDGDPLADITVLQDKARILAVMKDGDSTASRRCARRARRAGRPERRGAHDGQRPRSPTSASSTAAARCRPR